MRLVRGDDECDIQHEGFVLRIDRSGAPSSVAAFPEPAGVREAYERAIAEALAAGYAEATDPILDRDARLVHADALQLRGDPLGELIAVQHELALLPRDADPRQRARIEHRVDAILDEHHATWFGALERFVRKPSRKGPAEPAASVTWTLGFAEVVAIRATAALALDALYERLRELPLSRQIQTLVVGPPDAVVETPFARVSPYTAGPTYDPLLLAMRRHGVPSRMHELVLGADQAHRRPSIRIGDLAPVVAAAPALEVLRIVGGHGSLALASDTLRVLEVRDLVPQDLRSLREAALPRLEEIVLRARSPLGAPDLVELFPSLVHVTLEGFTRDGVTAASLIEYVGSGAASRLRTVALPGCDLDDRDLNALIRNPEAYAQLSRLDLRRNRFTRALAATAKQRVPAIRYR